MKKQPTHYLTLSELAAFASGAEGDLASLSNDELRERLSSQGIDPDDLARRTASRLRSIQNETLAKEAASRLTPSGTPNLTVDQMWQALQDRGVPIAARSSGEVSDEDIEVLFRLTFSEEDDGGTAT